MTTSGAAYLGWREATRKFVGGPQELRYLQDRRYRYAAEVARLLTQPGPDGTPVTGPVLYGVFSYGPGLIYIGQTTAAERRLWDLVIGESHHLANTVPPEVWDRIVVVQWPLLVGQVAAEVQKAISDLPTVVVGEGLERLMQAKYHPALNGRRRHRDGAWRERGQGPSRSRGAQAAGVLAELAGCVEQVWARLLEMQIADTGYYERAGRIVLPARLLDNPTPPQR